MIRRVMNMLTYSTLAKKYLMINKRRSVFTIVGVAFVTAFLFIVLNGIINITLQVREHTRQDEGDYEVVFYEMTPETMEEMVNDPRIVSAYIGTEFDRNSETEYPNALHVNVRHPYFLKLVLKSLEKDYGVKGEMNELVSWTYLQDSDGGVYIVIMFIILFTYIFTIIGVGVIKNSIELSNLEQIRDYGNLRCIGATKKEIERIIFCEGLYLEGAGIILGSVIGYPLYIIVALNVSLSEIFNDTTTRLSLSFHIVPVIIIFLVFLFDLYFTMKSSAKHIAKISPVSAIKGEFRIKKEKYKKRHSGLFGLIFGVEGDYAYKNVMRNKGRFIKTICAMALGLAAITFFGSFVGMLFSLKNDSENYFGYYRFGIEVENSPTFTVEEMKASLPEAEVLKRISLSKEIQDYTYSYTADVYAAEDIFMKDRMIDGSKSYAYGEYIRACVDEVDTSDPIPEFDSLVEVSDKGTDKDTEYKRFGIGDIEANHLEFVGYSGAEYARLEDRLVEGSLSLSEDGIAVVKGGYSFLNTEIGLEYAHMDFADIKIGDTIEVVDPVLLRERCLDKLEKSMRDYEEGVAKLTSEEIKGFEEDIDGMREKGLGYFNPDSEPNDFSHRAMIISEARRELMAEGKTRSFKVEGILDGDPNVDDSLEFILPLDRYLDFMGYTKEDWNGINYVLKNHLFIDDEIDEELQNLEEQFYGIDSIDTSMPNCSMKGMMYIEICRIIKPLSEALILIAFIIFVIVMINCINIANTSAASLHMRRKEFAQLKAMGMTDKGLTKAVILEGILALIFATIIGVVVGMGLVMLLDKLLFSIFVIVEGMLKFPWFAVILGFVLSGLVLVGSLYIPLRNMKKSLQAELTLSGE